jgi:transcriptional regulator with XRE-family HTH domain
MPPLVSNRSSGKSKLSKAVCELRARLGLSQQAFSNALGVALNTIARYETSREPSGEALKQLGDLAMKKNHTDLGHFFYTRYLDDVLKGVAPRVTGIPATDSEPARGYLLLELRGDDEMDYARLFRNLLFASRESKRVRELLLQLDKWTLEEMGLQSSSKVATLEEMGLQSSSKAATAKVRKEKK